MMALLKLFLEKALIKPSSITLFLSKFISNGFEISILFTSKDFASTLSVEKKNIFKDRNAKKIYKKCEKFLNLIFILYNLSLIHI